MKRNKTYGKARRRRFRTLDTNSAFDSFNTFNASTDSTSFARLPLSNLNANELSEESGIFGGKFASLARPVKQIFDLDSDSDIEDDDFDVFPTTPIPSMSNIKIESKKTEIETETKAKTETKTNSVSVASPEHSQTAFQEFMVRTVLKLDKTVAKHTPAKNLYHHTSTKDATKTLQFATPPPSPIVENVVTASSSPPQAVVVHRSSTLLMQHTTLSRPIIPHHRRRRPSKRAPLTVLPSSSISTEDDDDNGPTEVFDLETLTMLPRPKSNKASNSLAVKVAALARQRVRAQRSSTSINRLRRSSIMPGLQRNSSIGVSDRYSTTVLGSETSLASSRMSSSRMSSSRMSSSSRRSTNIFSTHLSSLRRSSLLGGSTVPSKSSVSSVAVGGPSTRGKNSTNKSSRRSSTIRRRASIFTSGAGGRRSSLVGGAPSANVTSGQNLETSVQGLSLMDRTELKQSKEDEFDEDKDENENENENENEDELDEFEDEFEEDDEYDLEFANENSEVAEDTNIIVIDVAAALTCVLEFLDLRELRSATMFVDKTWSRSTVSSMSWSIGNNVVQPNYDLTRLPARKLTQQYKRFQQTFPWGQFLCRGGFKSVYKVYCAHRKRMEAISVMDVNVIRSTNNQHIVRQEVHIGTLLSDLVTSGISPNFIETYGMFQTEMEEPTHLWGNENERKPRGPFSQHSVMKFNPKKYKKSEKNQNGDFCYIRMELCDGGDFEEFLKEKTHGHGIVPERETIGALFQMIASLDLAQQRFNLRHYDVKLLNFFLKKQRSLTNDEDEMVEIARYHYDQDEYIVEAHRDRAYVVKLADYGTADTSIETLNSQIDDTNFATLENTPPDFLLLGNQALQTFAADTFALGLSAVHLLTGDMPYEEILESVQCPNRLRREWTQVWRTDTRYEPLSIILGDGTDYTLHDTLYRYFVLFGFPAADGLYDYNENPILSCVQTCYRLDVESKEQQGKGNAWRAYAKDRARYGFLSFSEKAEQEQQQQHTLISRGRKRMESMYGMEELVTSLCHYNPKKRITMHDAIRSDTFESLRQ